MRAKRRLEIGMFGLLKECDSCKKREDRNCVIFLDPKAMIGKDGPRPGGVCRAWFKYRDLKDAKHEV